MFHVVSEPHQQGSDWVIYKLATDSLGRDSRGFHEEVLYTGQLFISDSRDSVNPSDPIRYSEILMKDIKINYLERASLL